MNELQALESLGLTLPSIPYIAGVVLFGIVGYVAYRRGRKLSVPRLTWAGVGMMLYPYAVDQTWLLWTVGAALSGWIYWEWDRL